MRRTALTAAAAATARRWVLGSGVTVEIPSQHDATPAGNYDESGTESDTESYSSTLTDPSAIDDQHLADIVTEGGQNAHTPVATDSEMTGALNQAVLPLNDADTTEATATNPGQNTTVDTDTPALQTPQGQPGVTRTADQVPGAVDRPPVSQHTSTSTNGATPQAQQVPLEGANASDRPKLGSNGTTQAKDITRH